MKIVLFDFDGVIVDTFAFCYRIIQARDGISEDEYRARFEGNINTAAPKKAPADPSAKPFDFFAQYTPELMACQPVAGIKEVILELAQQYVLIIISSTISPPIAAFLELHGLRSAFTEILGNDVEKSNRLVTVDKFELSSQVKQVQAMAKNGLTDKRPMMLELSTLTLIKQK